MKVKIYLFLLGLSLGLSSCASDPSLPQAGYPSYPSAVAPVLRQDITHVVAPGETLWRLSQMYDVPIADISRTNQLRSTALLKGQSLLIPGAAALRSVVSLYPNSKWKYIIIHHSATEAGDSLSFDQHHSQRGFGGVGYHFVINNGSHGKTDGQIETTPRWIKQQDGAHCKASQMNSKAIGICLVGNFNTDKVTGEQMKSLVYLVSTLRGYYRVPDNHILGHGKVAGANTDCPGKKFPWNEFTSRLRTGDGVRRT